MGFALRRIATLAVTWACAATIAALLLVNAHPTVGRAESRTLLVLGDSLTVGTNYKYFGNVTPQLEALGTFDRVIVDGAYARNITGLARTSRNGVKTYTKLILAGLRPSAVVIALGSNDIQESGKPIFFETRIREMLALIGDIPVVWINILRTDPPFYPQRSAIFNRVLARIAPEYPKLSVVDWATMLVANPKWVAFDKLHLQPMGYKARAAVYVEAAKSMWLVLYPPTTTTVPPTTTTTVPPTTTTTTVPPTTTTTTVPPTTTTTTVPPTTTTTMAG